MTTIAQDRQPSPEAIEAADGKYKVVERDGNTRLWQSVTLETNEVGVIARTNSYVELATGSAHLVNGQWVESTDKIQITPTGARATNSQHKVEFLGNINSAGAIHITLPEGDKHLVSTPIGLSYFDTESGNSVLIAELKDSVGQILPPDNQVLYPDAFTDISADVLYINGRSGFEQLIVLRQQLPSPADWNLDPETTVLQVITEFFNPPVPQITEHVVGKLPDQHLDFGLTQMPRGYAFALGEETNTILVTKQWLTLDGRQCLVESTPFNELEPLLEALPPAQAQLRNTPDSVIHKVASNHLLPARKLVDQEKRPLQAASISPVLKGVAIDYATATSQTNFTFQADTTYYVSSNVTLSGTTTFEGGAVIKFTNNTNAKISIGSFTCKTGPYRMVIFTSKDDNTVGESIPGSTGSPTNSNGGTYLSGSTGGSYKYMRFSYAGKGISGYVEAVNGGDVWHCQFYRCATAVLSLGGAGDYHNVLFSNCGTAVGVLSTFNDALRGEHITADQLDTFYQSGTFMGAWLTNSIFTGVTNLGSLNAYYSCVTNVSSAGFYQTVGAGSYYLADASTNRNAGDTRLNSTLLNDLKKKTTYPPIERTADFTTDTTLVPQAQRDTDTPDVGFHYDPLDYVVSGRVLTNSTLTLTNGVALGTYGTSSSFGINIKPRGKLYSGGSATVMNWIVRYNTVQEQTTTNWSSSTAAPSIQFTTAGSPNPQARFTFTAWSLPGNINEHFDGDRETDTQFVFKDCQFTGGKFTSDDVSTSFTNCLWDRVQINLDEDKQDPQRFIFNNLFRGGSVSLANSGSATWIIKDNYFHQTTIQNQSGSITHSNNAYISSYSRLTPTNANDVVLTNTPTFRTSYLGNFYYPTNDGMLSTLTNAGSRTASSASLYHYTCWTNQVKEVSSTVDIGFHYVATDSSGSPLDAGDSDGTPDYLEDTNGNGTADSGETNWQTAGDLGLRVIITRPRSGAIPLP